MNAAQRARWERARARGFWHYILLHWVLLWGGTMIIVTSVLDHFTSARGFRLEDLAIKVPIFLVGGLATGTMIWFYAEYRYKKNFGGSSRSGQ